MGQVAGQVWACAVWCFGALSLRCRALTAVNSALAENRGWVLYNFSTDLVFSGIRHTYPFHALSHTIFQTEQGSSPYIRCRPHKAVMPPPPGEGTGIGSSGHAVPARSMSLFDASQSQVLPFPKVMDVIYAVLSNENQWQVCVCVCVRVCMRTRCVLCA